jgi:hypothetical protein
MNTQHQIDLKKIAGKRWRTDYDPAYRAERKRGDDPQLIIVLCKLGHIYVHSASELGVATDGRHTGIKIARIPGVTIQQDGSDGMNLTFPPELLPRVAAIIKPRRRRQMTDEQRAAAGERLRALRA